MGRQSKRSRPGDVLLTGSTVAYRLIGADAIDDVRRQELAVEALCQLVTDTVPLLGKGDYRRQSELMIRLSGISLMAWGDEIAGDLSKFVHPVRWTMFLWMCLSRILELTEQLSIHRPQSQWNLVHDIISAWRDSWGDDNRARYARAHFSTLTGLTQGRQERAAFLHESLITVLSGIQA